MRRQAERVPDSAEKTVRDIRRATCRRYSAEDKIRIVLEGLRAERIRLRAAEGIHQCERRSIHRNQPFLVEQIHFGPP
jgi:transposase-like protein